MGSTWLDGVALRDADAFWDIIDEHKNVRAVVCGHVHQQNERLHNGVLFLSTPSTCAQFLPKSEFFALDERPPAAALARAASRRANRDGSGLGSRLAQLTGALAALAAALLAQRRRGRSSRVAHRGRARRRSRVARFDARAARARLSAAAARRRPLRRAPRSSCMELDLDDLDPATEQAAVLSAAALPAGQTLATVLDKKVYDVAQQRARGLGVDLAALGPCAAVAGRDHAARRRSAEARLRRGARPRALPGRQGEGRSQGDRRARDARAAARHLRRRCRARVSRRCSRRRSRSSTRPTRR